MGQKSWADKAGVPTGVMGETVQGITISESNRATVYERYREGIETLQSILRTNYKRKNVDAVLFGVHDNGSIKYAIFVQDGFLREVS